jgi:hypothetical protein
VLQAAGHRRIARATPEAWLSALEEGRRNGGLEGVSCHVETSVGVVARMVLTTPSFASPPGACARRGNDACILHAMLQRMTAKKSDVQIRGVPVALRERLRRRADSKGLSMSQYVIEILQDDLSRPTVAEWVSEIGKYPPIDLGGKTGAELVRETRREMGLED